MFTRQQIAAAKIGTHAIVIAPGLDPVEVRIVKIRHNRAWVEGASGTWSKAVPIIATRDLMSGKFRTAK